MPDLFVAPSKPKKNRSHYAHLLANFIEKPLDVRFSDQHDHEKILLVLRRHWITNVGWIVISLLLLVVPVFALSIVDLINFIPMTIPTLLILTGVAFWYLGTFGFILMNFLFWFYNVGIVTTDRIIDVDFVHLLYSEITATTIPKIEDVTNKRGGFLSVFFDYGNVFVQTAGTDANIEFMGIPNPTKVVRIISQLIPHD